MVFYSVIIMKTIVLHGYLNDLHPEPIRVHAETVAEAVSALQLYKAFDPKLGKRHSVIIDGFNSLDSLHDKTDVEEIHLHPVEIAAGGRNGFFQTIIGAVLVVVGLVVNYFAPGLGTPLIYAGIAMMIGGVIQMLMPQPKVDSVNTDQQRSQYLGARQNTVAIGTRIPLILGRCKAWGHYVSFDIDAGVMNQAPASWYSSNFTDFGSLTYSAAPDEISSVDPGVVDNQPIVAFDGFSNDILYFTPAVVLQPGQLDVTFNNGRSLHVSNDGSGAVTSVNVLGGNTADLPATGTPIVFTKNYV